MELVIGKSKTGKSKYLFEKIDDHMLNGKKVVYFVPSQMRAKSEEDYMNMQNKCGIIDLNITTISAFAKDFLDEYSISTDKYISKLDRKLVLSKLVLDNEDKFKLFNKVKNKEGFLDNLNIYMDIFKKEDIDLSKISSISLDNKLLEYKLKEIASIYEIYIEYTKDKFIDSIDEIDIFLKLFEEKYRKENISNFVYVFDSYNNFTNHEFKFIKLLLKLNFNLTFAVTSDICDKVDDDSFIDLGINDISSLLCSDEITNIFTLPNLTLFSIIKEAKKLKKNIDVTLKYNVYNEAKEDLKYLALNIFNNSNIDKIKSENVYISLTNNIYTECENIASIISKKVREGYRYNDFCILASNTDDYSYVIKKVFYEHNIPVYIDEKIMLKANTLIKYIIKLLDICMTGYKKENIFEILKYGLNDISFEDISYLENYVLEFNLDSYKFLNEFYINNEYNGVIYDIARLNDIRKKVINIYSNIIEFFKEKHTSKEIVTKIFKHLEENNILVNYLYIIQELNKSEDPSVIYFASVMNKMYESFCDILDSINKIYDDYEMECIYFARLFKMSIKDVGVKAIAPTIDEVCVLDINSSKIGYKKIMFLVNVNENILPLKPSNDMLFEDEELSRLNDEDIKIKETSLPKINMQLFNVYEHLNNVTDKLYVSFISSDKSGKSLRPSKIIGEITNILDISIKGNVTKSYDNLNLLSMYSDKEALEKLVYLYNNSSVITDEMLGIYNYLIRKEEYKSILEYSRISEKLNEETVSSLKKDKFVTSVSKLELFKKCPFAYFMKYSLKLEERKIYSITSMDIGSFMHDTVEKFSLYLLNNKIAWHEILLDELKYEKVINNIIDDELNRIFSKHKDNIKYLVLKQKLKVTMKKVIFVIATSFNQSKFIPLGYEIEFKEGSTYAPIEICLDNGVVMSLVGKIDRVDILDIEDKKYLRVVDYKSSTKNLNLNDIKEGISLQLITYLSAIIDSIKKNSEEVKILPAGMMYFNLSEKLVNLKEYTNDDDIKRKKIIEALRMKGIFLKDVQILKMMDSDIDNDNRLVDISLRSVNSTRKSAKILEEEEFNNLCTEIKDILKSIGEEIILGITKIAPNKKKDHCKYCEYSSICRKENMC